MEPGTVATRGRFNRKPYSLGPSMMSVISLSDPGLPARDTDEILPMKCPPLQRAGRAFFKPRTEVQDEDCLASHVRQLQLREAELKEEARANRRDHRKDMRQLRKQFECTFEEMAARRSWHRQVAAQQLQQARERGERRLSAHKEGNVVPDFWPFGGYDGRKVPLPDKKDYAKQLLDQVEQQKRGGTARSAPLHPPTVASRTAPAVRFRPPGLNTLIDPPPPAEIAEAQQRDAARRRAAQHDRSHGRQSHVHSYFPSDLNSVELEQRARLVVEHENKERMRRILEKQTAEKRIRETREHDAIYGAHRPTEMREIEERRENARSRRRELELQIKAKQAERKALKAMLGRPRKGDASVSCADETVQLAEVSADTLPRRPHASGRGCFAFGGLRLSCLD
ncbi:hypothetical protein AB1Y20_021279 [Prymnesium parvum]|uniref:Uncharacterized protein n=1 Tax=Prymnesium parvum TaxID=97485 RepID=A0AB34JL30_PRYPA